MPKLRVVSGMDMIKLAVKLGFEVKRQRGSHVILRKEAKRLVIPLHSTLKTGTLLQLLKTMGITREQLEELL